MLRRGTAAASLRRSRRKGGAAKASKRQRSKKSSESEYELATRPSSSATPTARQRSFWSKYVRAPGRVAVGLARGAISGLAAVPGAAIRGAYETVYGPKEAEARYQALVESGARQVEQTKRAVYELPARAAYVGERLAQRVYCRVTWDQATLRLRDLQTRHNEMQQFFGSRGLTTLAQQLNSENLLARIAEIQKRLDQGRSYDPDGCPNVDFINGLEQVEVAIDYWYRQFYRPEHARLISTQPGFTDVSPLRASATATMIAAPVTPILTVTAPPGGLPTTMGYLSSATLKDTLVRNQVDFELQRLPGQVRNHIFDVRGNLLVPDQIFVNAVRDSDRLTAQEDAEFRCLLRAAFDLDRNDTSTKLAVFDQYRRLLYVLFRYTIGPRLTTPCGPILTVAPIPSATTSFIVAPASQTSSGTISDLDLLRALSRSPPPRINQNIALEGLATN